MKYKSVILLIVVLIINSHGALAVPAYPYKVTVKTEDGKDVSISMHGDENIKYAVSSDGYTLINDSSGWWYAEKDTEGDIKKSAYRLMTSEDETEELRVFKKNCPKSLTLKPRQDVVNVSSSQDGGTTVKANRTIIGERRALVVLMAFKDVSFKKKKEEFVNLFNSKDYHENNAIGSVRDYYDFASQGQLDYVSDIYGPYTAQYNMRYYGANTGDGGSDSNPVALCIEAVRNLPADLDYSLYDNDGDGLVDNIHIIFAGHGEEAGASADAIWAHEYPHRIVLKNEVGYSLAGYSCSPELRGNSGNNITYIGVICHELGHALGAMDYYDTNYGTGGEFDGTGKWDIMASGSWNDQGRTPPNFNPYVRSVVFGWNKQVVLENNQSISMPRMEIGNSEQTVVYRLNTGSSGDYFLLENRQQYKFDAALPGAGMMVYHVHPNIEKYNTTNTINASHPQGFYPVCAAYSEPSRKNYGTINSAACPFPGSNGKMEFSSVTAPAAVAWNGSAATVPISSIVMKSTSGVITFATGEGNPQEPDKPDNPDEPTERNVVYVENFENSINDRINVSSVIGKEIWRTYPSGEFIMNADIIPKPSEGTHLFMMFSGKNATMSESEAVSNEITIEPGASYSLSFDYYSTPVLSSPIPTFNLYIEDEYGEYNVCNLNETTEQWKTIEIPVVLAGDHFHYKLYGNIFAGGIFIDNIKLFKEDVVSSVRLNGTETMEAEGHVYLIDGAYMGIYKNLLHSLKHGIYILKQKDKTWKKFVVR